MNDNPINQPIEITKRISTGGGYNTILGNSGVNNVKSYLEFFGYAVWLGPEGNQADIGIQKYIDKGFSPSNMYLGQVKFFGTESSSISFPQKIISGTGSGKVVKEYTRGSFDIYIVWYEPYQTALFFPYDFFKLNPSVKMVHPKKQKHPYYYFEDFTTFNTAVQSLESKNLSIYRQRFSDSKYLSQNIEKKMAEIKLLEDIKKMAVILKNQNGDEFDEQEIKKGIWKARIKKNNELLFERQGMCKPYIRKKDKVIKSEFLDYTNCINE